MSSEIEEKVVSLRFDNTDFEPNVEASIKTLGKLETALQYSNGYKGLENAEKAVNDLNGDISLIAKTLDGVGQGFSAMGVAAITVISDITRRLEHMGLNTLNSLFVAPVKTGFVRYGEQIQSTQVIMNNTGETIDRVKDKLGELNEYANKTIYNFSQMTYAVGKFAAAGVELDAAIPAIKGLSNAAAMVGANNAQLYSAYYNLSQSMQMGYLKLIDWKSIANSMIGTKQMRQEFVKTAIEMGKFTEDSEVAQNAFKNFEDSLHTKWLTSDIIVKTLEKYSDATTNVGKAAVAAASELKSFSQMWDVISQTTMSSWAKTWEIIIGDLAGAKTVWTNIGTRINSIMTAINNKRNEFLEGWNKDGRATKDLLETICNALNNLRIILENVYGVAQKVFNITGDKLYEVVQRIKDLSEAFAITDEMAEAFRKILYQVLKPIQLLVSAVGLVGSLFLSLVKILALSVSVIVMFVSNLDKLPDVLSAIFGENYESKIMTVVNIFNSLRYVLGLILEIVLQLALATLPAIGPLLSSVATLLLNVLYIIASIVEEIANSDLEWLSNLTEAFVTVLHSLSIILSVIPKLLSALFSGEAGDNAKNLVNIVSKLAVILSKLFEIVVTFVANTLVTIAPVLEGIGKVILAIANIILGFFNGFSQVDTSGVTGVFNGISNILAIILGLMSKLGDSIAGVIGSITSSINNVAPKAEQAGSKISESISNNIAYGTGKAEDALNNFADSASGALEKASDKITQSTAEASGNISEFANQVGGAISSKLENNEGTGEAIVKSMVRGINKSTPLLNESAEELNSGLSKSIESSSDDKLTDAYAKKIGSSLTNASKKLKGEGKISQALGLDSSVNSEFSNVKTNLEQCLNEIINTLNSFKDNVAIIAEQISSNMKPIGESIQSNVGNKMEPVIDGLDRFFNTLEKHKDLITKLLIVVPLINGLVAAIMVGIISLATTIGKFNRNWNNFGSSLEKAADNFTNFKFDFTKTAKDEKKQQKAVESFATSFMKMSISISGILLSTALILKLIENYDFIKDDGTLDQNSIIKISIVFGTVGAVVGGLAALCAHLANTAAKTGTSVSEAGLNFEKSSFQLIGGLNSFKNGIREIGVSGDGLIPALKYSNKTTNNFVAIGKLLKSIAAVFTGVMVSISAFMLVTKLYTTDELTSRLDGVITLISVIAATTFAVTSTVMLLAKNLDNADPKALDSMGQAISKIIRSLGAVAFALKFLFNDKKLDIPDNYVYIVGIIFTTITTLTAMMLMMVNQLSKNYEVNGKTHQDERLKQISRSIAMISVGLAALVASFGLLKEISIDDNAAGVIGATLTTAIALSGIAILSVNKLFKSVSKTDSLTKERANRILKIAAAMDMIMGGLVTIVLSLKPLNRITIDANIVDTMYTLGLVSGALATLLIVISNRFKEVNGKDIAKVSSAMGISVGAIVSLALALRALNEVSIDESISGTLFLLSAVVGGLFILLNMFSNSSRNISQVAISIAAMGGAVAAICTLALALKQLQGVDVSWKAMAQLAAITGIVAGLGFAAKGIGSGGGYVMIGVAAIIALTIAIIGCAEAVVLLGKADFNNVTKGLILLATAVNALGFEKIAGLNLALLGLGVALMILAPGMAIVCVGLLALAGAFAIAANALPILVDQLERLAVSITDSNGKLRQLFDYITSNEEAISKASQSLTVLGQGFYAMGIGLSVTSIGLWLINKRVFAFTAMVIGAALALDLAALGIWALSSNLEGFNGVLKSIHDSLNDIIALIYTLGASGLGGMFLGIGFEHGAKGILYLAQSFKILAQGILWLVGSISAAIIVFKIFQYFLGEEFTNTIDNIKEKLKSFFSDDNWGLKLAGIIVGLYASMALLGKGAKALGKGLQKLAVPLLIVSVAMNIFAAAMDKFSGFDGGFVASNLMAIAGGLFVFNLLLSLIAPTIAVVAPSIALLAGGLALLGNALKIFDTSGSYADLGNQLVTLAIGLIALSGAAYIADMVKGPIGDLSALLTNLAKKSEDWVPLAVNIREMIVNIATGILYFSTIISNGIESFGNAIEYTSTLVMSASDNIDMGIESIAGSVENGSARILSASQNIALAINNVVNAISNAKSKIGFGGGITGLIGNAIGGVGNVVKSNLSNSITSTFKSIGSWIPKSMAAGIIASAGEPINAAHHMDTNTEETIRNDLGIHSLSELFAKIGEWIPQSIGIGIKRGTDGAIEGVEIMDSGIAGAINKATNGKIQNALNSMVSTVTGAWDKVQKFKEGGLQAFLGEGGLLGALGIDLDAFSDIKEQFADALDIGKMDLGGYASALDNAASSASSAKGTIESLTDTISNQLKIFERFTADEDIMNPKELINNMESQLRGVQNWANGLDMLAVRGISGPLLQYLSEMGPEGYKYVEAFLEMTESEFSYANELYSKSLEMPGNTANQIADSYRRVGVEIVEGVKDGYSGAGGTSSVNDDITENAEETGDKVYEIAGTKATATAEELEAMAKESAKGTGWAYFTALDQWMSSDEARKYIASVQGKIEGQVFNFSNFDMTKAAAQAGIDGFDYYISSNWDYKNKSNLQQIGKSSAKFIVDGYNEALTAGQYIAECQKAMYGLAAVIIDAGNEKFDIHSPSKVSEKQAMYYVEGLAQGLKKYTSLAESSSEELGEDTINSLSETIKKASEFVTSDLDTAPTIRPVLDLTNVYDGVNQLDALFSTRQASIAANAYTSMRSSEDGVSRLQSAIDAANARMANQIVAAIQQSDKEVIVNVNLNGSAADFFDAMVDQTIQTVKSTGKNPLLKINNNSLKTGIVS